MSNTLTTTTTGEIVALNEERVALITKMCGNGLSPVELELFLHVCKRTGLDPLMKQIHAIKRQGKLTIQTGIGGFQLIADRTGAYAGSDEAIFVDGSKGHPEKATVTVYKLVGGVRCSFTHSARWSEFYPGDAQGFMWKKMPYHMLAKVAESLALRKAFPQELSGLYTDEEMDQADHEPQAPAQQQPKQQRIEPPKAAPPASPARERQPGDPDPEEIIDEPTRKHLGSLFTGSGWKWADLVAKIGAAPGAKPADLCYRQYEAAVTILSPAKAG